MDVQDALVAVLDVLHLVNLIALLIVDLDVHQVVEVAVKVDVVILAVDVQDVQVVADQVVPEDV